MKKIYADECLERAQTQTDVEFIAHARVDVPALAGRLKRAIQALRLYGIEFFCEGGITRPLADELEAPLDLLHPELSPPPSEAPWRRSDAT